MKSLAFLVACLVAAPLLAKDYPPTFKDARVETYRKVDSTELKLWIFGESIRTPKPAIVFFFGDGWLGSERTRAAPSTLDIDRRVVQKTMTTLPGAHILDGAEYRVFDSRHPAKFRAPGTLDGETPRHLCVLHPMIPKNSSLI